MAKNRRKLFYKIGEVARICEVEPHVLRYWETVFPRLRPAKSRSGQRIYRNGDVELARRIRRLLYEEGYTISGANQKLREEAEHKTRDLPLFDGSPEVKRRQLLVEIDEELRALEALLRED
ncbi:MAG TPA: MerR family transcriptional regulator [Acidobacteriota bacterium]|nr:MerR family transcriptional regulator [Acidobacteriota bacterium]